MRLVEATLADFEAVSDGRPIALPTAPGWPHDGTLAGLGFIRHGGAGFLILDDDGRVIGECGTKSPPRADGGVEIGYGLSAPTRGKGMGTQAVAELIARLEAHPEVIYIEAEIHETNVASRRLAERLGFVVHSGPNDGYYWYRRPVFPK